jgi:hypothetical protein
VQLAFQAAYFELHGKAPPVYEVGLGVFTGITGVFTGITGVFTGITGVFTGITGAFTGFTANTLAERSRIST